MKEEISYWVYVNYGGNRGRKSVNYGGRPKYVNYGGRGQNL